MQEEEKVELPVGEAIHKHDVEQICVLEVKGLEWANHGHSSINLQVRFSHWPEHFLPYTLNQYDTTEHGQELYAAFIAGKLGEPAECTAPTPEQQAEMMFPAYKKSQQDKLERSIAPLARAVALGIATDEETEQLKELEIKSVKMMRAVNMQDEVFQ